MNGNAKGFERINEDVDSQKLIELLTKCISDWEDNNKSLVIGLKTANSIVKQISMHALMPGNLFIDKSILYAEGDGIYLSVNFEDNKKYNIEYIVKNKIITSIGISDKVETLTLTSFNI